jgi:hypothetical protein
MFDHPLELYGAAVRRVRGEVIEPQEQDDFAGGRDLFLFFQAAIA